MTTKDKTRAEFEAHAKRKGMSIERAPSQRGVSEKYWSVQTQQTWEGWKAACEQQWCNSLEDAIDGKRARFIMKNANYVTGEFTDQLGIVQSFYWDAELGENITEEIDLAIAAQGASNV